MKRGKQICKILKDIRKQIAEANDIEFITSECQYQGDCLGTCPKCEAEVRYLEQQLERKQLTGKAIAILGISTGMITMAPLTSCMNMEKKEMSHEVKNDTIKKTISPFVRTLESEVKFVPFPIGIFEDDKVFGMTDDMMPTFPGGQSALMEFLDQNIKHSLTKESNQNKVRIIVEFIIDKNGKIRKPQVAKRSSDADPRLKKEALRVIKLMPKWSPGTQNNKPVSVRFTVPITFKQK